ncbi:MAG: transcription termination/antitermination protein NusG [Saprospiraceae bacterium]
MSVHSIKRWHAIYVASRCERMVATQLMELGIESMVPITKELRQWSDRRKWVEKVLFPNYVFLCVDIHVRQTVKGLRHVVGYVKSGGEEAVLSEKEVNLIKNIGKLTNPVTIHHEKLGVGDEVEIVEGPLRSLRGHIISNNDKIHLLISIPSLGCFSEIIIGKNEVKRCI